MKLNEDELIDVLVDALRHAIITLQLANAGESLVEVEQGLNQVHGILADAGIKFNTRGQLVPLRRIGFIQDG